MRTGSGLELVNFPVFPPNNQEFNRKSLLGMPNEVKSMIFYQIEDGVDQVAFQLTCTAIATATSGHRLHQLPVNRHGNNPNRYNILKALGSWGWIPGVKILCRLCAKYSVIRKQWKDSSGKPINQRGFKEYKPTEVYELWRKYHICPSCQFPVVAGRNHLYNAIRPRCMYLLWSQYIIDIMQQMEAWRKYGLNVDFLVRLKQLFNEE